MNDEAAIMKYTLQAMIRLGLPMDCYQSIQKVLKDVYYRTSADLMEKALRLMDEKDEHARMSELYLDPLQTPIKLFIEVKRHKIKASNNVVSALKSWINYFIQRNMEMNNLMNYGKDDMETASWATQSPWPIKVTFLFRDALRVLKIQTDDVYELKKRVVSV